MTFDVKEYRAWLLQWAGASDPRIDEVWKHKWVRGTGPKWKDERRDFAIRQYEDATFILQHWHDLGDGDSLCDAYDPETKRCLAYEGRPPICRDYPYYSYGVEQLAEMIGDDRVHCSFWADVPEKDQPARVKVILRSHPSAT